MKKIIALLTLFALILTFAACAGDSTKGEDGTSENGGVDTSIPLSALSDYDALNITADIKVGQMSATQTYSYMKAGEFKLYGVRYDSLTQYYVNDNGEVKGYSGYYGQSEYTPIELNDPSLDGSHLFTLFGFANEDFFDEFLSAKTGEEKIGEYDCTVYDVMFITDGEEIEMRVWQDKESGIWVKSMYTVEGKDYECTVTDISTDTPDFPGTIPVTVSAGEVYSNAGLTLNLKDIVFDPNYAATLMMEAVNATDSALKVKSKYFDVNGFCIGGNVFNISVPAGQSLVFEIQIPDSSCSAAGIDMIGEMVFAVSAEKYHTENDGEGTYDVSDGMLIPRSEEIKITTVCPVELPKEESGERRVLCSTPDFDVYFGGIKENASGGYDFIVYYESEFSEDIRVTANIHEVNGVAYDDFEKIYIYAGRKGFGGFSFWKDKVTEKPTTVKLSFEAYYGELYNGTCILEETEPFVLTVG